jgi:hypothetical protein
LEEAIFPAIREYYNKNSDFKELIDNINPEFFKKLFEFINNEAVKHTETSLNIESASQLFDTDLCVFIQNVTQAPVRLQISPEFVCQQYNKYNFINLRRLKRYVKRQNIRQFFAPLHYNHEHPVSKLLYGSGNLEYIAQKKA